MTASTTFAQLIIAASDPDASAERLLRAAHLVALALDDGAMSEWCRKELEGYPDRDVPQYRQAQVQVLARTPLGETVPYLIPEPEKAKAITSFIVLQPIAQVQQTAGAKTTQLRVDFVQAFEAVLLHGTDAVEVFRLIQRSAFEGILSGVRQRVYAWAVQHASKEVALPAGLQLSTILGMPAHTAPVVQPAPVEAPSGLDLSGAVFSGPVQLNVNSPGSSSSISQGVDVAGLAGLIAALAPLVESNQKAGAADLRSALNDLRGLVASPEPNRSWVSESLKTVRTVVEGAASSWLAEGTKAKVLSLVAMVGKSIGLV